MNCLINLKMQWESHDHRPLVPLDLDEVVTSFPWRNPIVVERQVEYDYLIGLGVVLGVDHSQWVHCMPHGEAKQALPEAEYITYMKIPELDLI